MDGGCCWCGKYIGRAWHGHSLQCSASTVQWQPSIESFDQSQTASATLGLAFLLQCTIGNKADTTHMLSRGLLKYFLMPPVGFFKRKWLKYMWRVCSTQTLRQKCPQNCLFYLHWYKCPPGWSKFPSVQWLSPARAETRHQWPGGCGHQTSHGASHHQMSCPSSYVGPAVSWCSGAMLLWSVKRRRVKRSHVTWVL